jgi:hypothetical protein
MKSPAVPRANYGAFDKQTLRQRCTGMGACVVNGAKRPSIVEYGNRAIVYTKRFPFAFGNIIDLCHGPPL